MRTLAAPMDLPATRSAARSASRALELWLLAIAALVALMVVVGGATRLTDSGLSITEWQPIMGAIPPLTDADWQTAFAKYKQIPEYQQVNRGMSLNAFKVIFWWEWGHRFLGRLIGLAFALPLAVFWWRGMIPSGFRPRLVGLLVLGGLQGAMGWYMVQSGLVDRIDVSQYRLAAHLTLAFLIFAALLWTARDLAALERTPPIVLATPTRRDHALAASILLLVFLQVALGGLVAGLKAGLAHNTWPLMDGRIIPSGLGAMAPWYLNIFENALTVQFNHRIGAYLLAIAVIAHAIRIAPRVDDAFVVRSAFALAVAVFVQMALGIWTLLAHVPLWLGIVHQGGAVVVLAIAVLHTHALWRIARVR